MIQNNGQSSRARVTSFLSQLNRDATITASVKGTINNATRGARTISAQAENIYGASRSILGDGRVETFEQAMTRLGVGNVDLPLIHNQIVLQSYVTFFAAFISLVVSVCYFITGGQVAAGVLSAVLFVSCLSYFAQSSTRALQVRLRQLGLFGEWLSSPAEWFPSRLPIVRKLSRSDPLRHPDVVRPLARTARKYAVAAVSFLLLGTVIQFLKVSGQIGAWFVLFYFLGFFSAVAGARLSFEVFRRRTGYECDLGLWLLSPADWIPREKDVRTEELLASIKSSKSSQQPPVNIAKEGP